MSALESRVGQHNGRPCLFINGNAHNGIMVSHKGFLFGQTESAYATARSLREEGVEIYRDTASIRVCPDGSLDTSEFDRHLEGLFAACPDMLYLARLPRPEPPQWWAEAHPDQLMVHRDPYTGQVVEPAPSKVRPSLSSELWRRDVSNWVAEMVHYCEEQYADKVVGYFLHGGVFEWAYSWDEVLSDYSSAQVEGFRNWLRDRYDDDVERLRDAWTERETTFERAEVPLDRARTRPQTPALLDPTQEQRIIDYLIFHSEVVADALVELAGAVKLALREVGSCKVLGSWYGYEFWPAGHAAHYHNSGHHNMQRVLNCPDIDFFSLIHSHFERKPGGLWVHHMAGSSVTAHGKLLYEEDDTATHAAREEMSWQQACRTPAESRGVLTRNAMGILSAGGSIYWHDFSGERWFAGPDVATHIGRLVRLFDEQFATMHEKRAQVAVLVSKRSKRYFRQDAVLTDGLYCRQISELLHCGAPVDVFYAEDVELLVEQGDLKGYSLLVFVDFFSATEGMQRAVRNGLACEGRTLLWCYGAGFVTQAGFCADAMRDLTGMPVELRKEPQVLRATTYWTGSLVQYGPHALLSPVLVGRPERDENVRVMGHYVQPDAPALMVKDFADWRSVWSGAPTLPAVVLRRIMVEAGVHVYTDSGDQAFAMGDLLAIHAAYAGERMVRLRAPARVTHALTGEKLAAEPVGSFVVLLERGGTPVWRLSAD